MTALELTNEERKRAETNCPYCRSKVIPMRHRGAGGRVSVQYYECGTGHLGYPQGAKCKTILLARELKETELRHHLINAVNASCSCGGRPITDRKTPCQACEVWHRFVENVEECK